MFRTVLSVLVIAVILGFLAYESVPGLLRDFRLRNGDAVPIQAEVSGDCKVYLFAINFCDVKLTSPQGAESELLVFFDFSLSNDGYSIQPMADKNDPTHLTSSLALEKFWNRAITMAVFFALLLLPIVTGIGRMMKGAPPKPAAA